jgi:hypothetical protein
MYFLILPYAVIILVNISKFILVESDDDVLLQSSNNLENSDLTLMEKYRFCINDLPDQLQYIHKLFRVSLLVSIIFLDQI